VERFHDLKFSAAYVAATGIHLTSVYSPNSYGGASPRFAPYTHFDSAGNPTGGIGNEAVITSGSHSSYHSLQASISKNSPRAGLGLQGSYTYSKSLDDTSSVLGGLVRNAGVLLQALPQDPWNPRAEKGPSTFDVTHVFSVSVIQLLPIDRVGFMRPLGRTLTSGWQFLNITTLMSGPPFTVFSGVQQTGVGSGGADRPDLVSQPHFSTSRSVQRRLLLAREPTTRPSFQSRSMSPEAPAPTRGRFGTLWSRHLRGPGLHDFDVALIKRHPFGRRGNAELGTVEFRAEFFNVFNIVNSDYRINTLRGSGFGLISKTAGSSLPDSILTQADLLNCPALWAVC
jgi:hypothetical protein